MPVYSNPQICRWCGTFKELKYRTDPGIIDAIPYLQCPNSHCPGKIVKARIAKRINTHKH